MAKTTSKTTTKNNNPHKSFKRSYREDYVQDFEAPSLMQHFFSTFKLLFKNWKLFLPLLVIIVLLNFLFVGVTNESNYTQLQNFLNQSGSQSAENLNSFSKAGLLFINTITAGGLFGNSSESAIIINVLLFLIIWLVTIYLLRQLLAGHKVKLRDGLYNAMTPLLSTFVVFIVAVVQCIPIFLLIIAYSAAIQTDFLSTPFYALLFLVFAILMIILSGYLLSSSIIAFVAVSAPGLYPLPALRTASELMMGRRIKFIIRIIALIIMLVIIWAIIMLPLIMFDLWMKSFEWATSIPFIPICITIMTTFTCIYLTGYLYLYYRWMLDYDEK